MSATCAPSNTMLGKSTEYIDTYESSYQRFPLTSL